MMAGFQWYMYLQILYSLITYWLNFLDEYHDKIGVPLCKISPKLKSAKRQGWLETEG